MGEGSILTESQKLIFGRLSTQEYLKKTFYFTGGTALSEVYLKHRESEDLDFFSLGRFDSQAVFTSISGIAKSLNLKLKTQKVAETNIYVLSFSKGNDLKVDFAYYPYKRLKKGIIYNRFEVDSEFDIAVNKLLLIASQRIEIKDFVDLYFLSRKFSAWDLIEGVGIKFNVKIEPYILASDLLAVKDFEFLPKMLKPLTLAEVKDFYIGLSRTLGKESMEE